VFVQLTLLIANVLNIATRRNATNTAQHAAVFSGVPPLKQNQEQRAWIMKTFIAKA